jgi:hypothetical protein
MARKLKTYVTTSGFFDLAVAAPSMKAASEIWGGGTNQFQKGFARETTDPDIVKATMERPGVVLRRPVGTKQVFKEQAALPSLSALEKGSKRKPEPLSVKKVAGPGKPGKTANRKAAKLYDLAQKRREREEQREEERRQREHDRREAAVARAQALLDAARERHAERLSELEAQRDALDRKVRLEKERWDEEKSKLQDAIKRAAD